MKKIEHRSVVSSIWCVCVGGRMANLGDKKRHFLGTTLNIRLNDGREVDKQRQRELFYSH